MRVIELENMQCFHLFVGHIVIITLTSHSVITKSVSGSKDLSTSHLTDSFEWDILMKDAKPNQPDAYLCSAYPVEYDEAYIYKFEALAEASTAHHMLLYGCDGGAFNNDGALWSCPPICSGRSQTIMFAWAKNAPPTQLPPDVGLQIGKKSRIKTIVLQIHYAKSFTDDSPPDKSGLRLHITKQRQRYSAGILLMLASYFVVPPHNSAYPVDMSCKYTKAKSIFPFAYRTHAHSKGKVITGYQYNGTYHEIGKGNPQWPQAFYPVKDKIEIKQNDFLAARCTYDSSGVSTATRIGATGNDEMCNFYIMYYTDSSVHDTPMECFDNQFPRLTGNNFPADVSVPLPQNAAMESEAKHHHHGHHSPMGSSHIQVQSTAKPIQGVHIEKKLVYQPWHSDALNIGQVGGVSTDKEGNVYIFHRGYRVWDYKSFDLDDNFIYQNAPIDEDVVLIVDKNGGLIRKFGKGQFFMPHGVKVDLEGNIWLTDVALHQVFKVPKDQKEPVLTLGQRFKHGKGLNYFCKPTDVAVLSTGEVFVADGYCNGRVVKYSKDGKALKSWGKKSMQWGSNQKPMVFNIAHSIAVSEKDDLLCVADRENGRIQCFDLNGNFKHIIKHKEFGTKLFAIDYSPMHGGLLYAVNGPSGTTVQGFTMDMKNGALIEQWNLPQGFKKPHDVCVDLASESVYVGELDPRTVWKMTRMTDKEAKALFDKLSHLHDEDEHSHAAAGDDDKDNGHKSEGANEELQKKQKPFTGSPNSSSKHLNSSTQYLNSSQSNELIKMQNIESGLSFSMVMGLILVVPVVLILVVVIIVKRYRSGNMTFFTQRGGKNKRIFNMQHILGNSHKGFDPLSTEESDHDLDPDDSDQEEYAAPKKAKT